MRYRFNIWIFNIIPKTMMISSTLYRLFHFIELAFLNILFSKHHVNGKAENLSACELSLMKYINSNENLCPRLTKQFSKCVLFNKKYVWFDGTIVFSSNESLVNTMSFFPFFLPVVFEHTYRLTHTEEFYSPMIQRVLNPGQYTFT